MDYIFTGLTLLHPPQTVPWNTLFRGLHWSIDYTDPRITLAWDYTALGIAMLLQINCSINCTTPAITLSPLFQRLLCPRHYAGPWVALDTENKFLFTHNSPIKWRKRKVKCLKRDLQDWKVSCVCVRVQVCRYRDNFHSKLYLHAYKTFITTFMYMLCNWQDITRRDHTT